MTPKPLVAALVALLLSSPALAQPSSPISYKPKREYRGQTIWDVTKIKEREIDIGLWALVVAKEFDSTVNVPQHLATLDSMADEIGRMLAGRQSDMDKLLAVRMFQFEAGPWNDGRPFQYDLSDPFGKSTQNKLLSTYLTTRNGNCVSMPTLFLALMERIDPNVQLAGSVAPKHLFCRYRDRQTNDEFNIEPTNGGHPARNEWVIEQTGISQTALDAGTYLRSLTKREFVAQLVQALVNKENNAGNHQQALKYADLTMKLAPNAVSSYLNRIVTLMWMHDKLNEKARRTGIALTKKEKRRKALLHKEVRKLEARVLAMGWQPQPEESDAAYLRSVEAERSRRMEMGESTATE